MSTTGLPTIGELVAEAARTLPEPFRRAALLNWVSARRPEVGIASIAREIQLATANAGHVGVAPGAHGAATREPLLYRVDRGLYLRFRPAPAADVPAVPSRTAGPVVLIGSSGPSGSAAVRVADLFESPGFVRARDRAVAAGAPWFVLSAKHGLLDPDDVVGPFDVQLGDASPGYRTAWGEWVAAGLGDRLRLDGVVVEVHGGVDFAQPLRQPLARRGAALEIPLPRAWRETAPEQPDLAEEEYADRSAPVRAAIERLRGLVSHRAL